MNPARPSTGQPPLEQLLAGYLNRQAAAHAEGTAFAESRGEVVPFDAGSTQPVDPKLAWTGAVAALRTWQPSAAAPTVPPDWPALVAAQEPVAALPYCAGNFPQLVRELQPLLQATDLTALRPTGGRTLSLGTLSDWAARQQEIPHVLFAVGVLRLARQFDAAADLL